MVYYLSPGAVNALIEYLNEFVPLKWLEEHTGFCYKHLNAVVKGRKNLTAKTAASLILAAGDYHQLMERKWRKFQVLHRPQETLNE